MSKYKKVPTSGNKKWRKRRNFDGFITVSKKGMEELDKAIKQMLKNTQ